MPPGGCFLRLVASGSNPTGYMVGGGMQKRVNEEWCCERLLKWVFVSAFAHEDSAGCQTLVMSFCEICALKFHFDKVCQSHVSEKQ